MSDIIQSLWIGESLGKMEQLSAKSFIDHGHTYHLYTYGKVENIPEGVIVKDGNVIGEGFHEKRSGFMEGAAGRIPKRTFGPGVGHVLFPASSDALGHPSGRPAPTCVSKKKEENKHGCRRYV